MRNQSKEYIVSHEQPQRRKWEHTPALFCGDDYAQQEQHKKPITTYSTAHFTQEQKWLPFSLASYYVGIPRFYAVMYAVFVSLKKIYAEGTVRRWSAYLTSFLPKEMFPNNKRRKLQEVLENTWELVPNFIQNGPSKSRFSTPHAADQVRFQEQFAEMKKFF